MNCIDILENFIDGLELEDLSPEDVFEMIPAVGIAKKIIRRLPGHSDKVSTRKFHYECSNVPIHIRREMLAFQTVFFLLGVSVHNLKHWLNILGLRILSILPFLSSLENLISVSLDPL